MPQLGTTKRSHSSTDNNQHDPKCIFCKILQGQLPGSTVYEDDTCRILLDLHPIRPGHALIIPRQHYQNIIDMPPEVATHMMQLAHSLTQSLVHQGDNYHGTNLMWNNGRAAWQTVLHAHLHVIPRTNGDGGAFLWGIIRHILSLMGLVSAANRTELDRMARSLGEQLTKHINKSN